VGEKANGPLTSAGLLAARRRNVETSLGFVQVRALGFAQLAGMLGQLLDVSSLSQAARALQGNTGDTDQVQRVLTDPKVATVLPMIERVVAAGCIEPKFGDDPSAGAVVADLPIEDQFLLFTDIFDLSGHPKTAGDGIRP